MAIRGTFKDLSFFEMVQIMFCCKKTGRMEATLEKKWAMVIFSGGELWHIEPRGFDGTTADEVMHNMIGLAEGNFVFQSLPWIPDIERSLTMTTADIIERYSQHREADGGGEMSSPMNASIKALRLKENAESKIRYVPQNVRKILQCIDGVRTRDEVIALSQLKQDIAEVILKDLTVQEVIEEIDAVPEQPPVGAAAS